MAVHHLPDLNYHHFHLLLLFQALKCSELRLFGKIFPPSTFSSPTELLPLTLGQFNVSILLNGWICLHDVLD